MCSFTTHLFSLYTWELNFSQTIWDKIEVLYETSWEKYMRTWGTFLRTWWEHIEKKEKKKNPSPRSLSCCKYAFVTSPFSCNFLFSAKFWNCSLTLSTKSHFLCFTKTHLQSMRIKWKFKFKNTKKRAYLCCVFWNFKTKKRKRL